MAHGLKFHKKQIKSIKLNPIINSYYHQNCCLYEVLLQDKLVKEFMDKVKLKNQLLYACITNDLKLIEEILSDSNTNLMNECLLTVVY